MFSVARTGISSRITNAKISVVRLHVSVTRLGDFCNILASNFLTKVAQIFDVTFGATLRAAI